MNTGFDVNSLGMKRTAALASQAFSGENMMAFDFFETVLSVPG